jgi:hypothetical protein
MRPYSVAIDRQVSGELVNEQESYGFPNSQIHSILQEICDNRKRKTNKDIKRNALYYLLLFQNSAASEN